MKLIDKIPLDSRYGSASHREKHKQSTALYILGIAFVIRKQSKKGLKSQQA
jgi:hypothetical protein